MYGHLKTVELLVRMGADPQARTGAGLMVRRNGTELLHVHIVVQLRTDLNDVRVIVWHVRLVASNVAFPIVLRLCLD